MPTLTTKTHQILVYSDDVNTRASIVAALGRRPSADGLPVTTIEIATEPALMAALDDSARQVSKGGQGVSLVILDGEATPAGGMGISRAIKDEIFNAPRILLVVGRPGDAWLASWSRADAVVSHPIDPLALATAAAGLLAQIDLH